jgi:hypothetical protein
MQCFITGGFVGIWLVVELLGQPSWSSASRAMASAKGTGMAKAEWLPAWWKIPTKKQAEDA